MCNFRLLVSFILLFSLSAKAQEFLPTEYPDRINLTFGKQDATPAVTWRVSANIDSGIVEIAPAKADPEFTRKKFSIEAKINPYDDGGVKAHFFSAILDDLEPDSLYAYRVGKKERWSEWFHFRTPSDKNDPFTFLYFGDAQNDLKSLWSRTIRQANLHGKKIDFMLHAGDLVNRGVNDPEWGEWFYAGGWLYGMIPSIATPGNHEFYRDDNGDRHLTPLWQPTFEFPQNGPEGLKESVYYFDYQGCRFISLNTQAMFEAEENSPQPQWLESVLKNNDQKWTIVTFHHPIYSSGYGRDNPDLRNALKPLFEKYDVDLVLQGHDHAYGRGGNIPVGLKNRNIKGPVYVVSVSGPKMYNLSMGEWMDRGAASTQLYQIIDVTADQINFASYTVTGELYDQFEIIKRDHQKIFIDHQERAIEENVQPPQRYQERFSDEDWKEFQNRFDAYKEKKSKTY
ncbi:purple acid phosphatase family protein [Membranihabitans maritimus]|uniref:purple acid phosphatase family protein n=1 Tax=Membranihabitans maritimus TaxID=2904244 RepID=UPI001F17BC11|nr:metallophosphoesterase family protein [Membranihabitans maritimus]